MTLNGAMAVILRYFTKFGDFEDNGDYRSIKLAEVRIRLAGLR